MHFYRDKAGFDQAAKVNVLLTAGGLDRRPVTLKEIRDIEPTLNGSLYAGFFTPSDATGDIHKFTRGLADACVRRNVRFFYDTFVDAIVPCCNGGFHVRHSTAAREDSKQDGPQSEPLYADAVVVCAGTGSRSLGATLGDRLNIYPVKGYSITIHLQTPECEGAAPTVSILDDATKIVTSRLGRDRFRVAGTAEFNGYNRDIRHDRIEPLINWTRTHFPDLATDCVVPWTGLRPMMPGMLPRVGPGKRRGIFYNTGHGHLGWTLSAATAEVVAESVVASFLKARRMPIALRDYARCPDPDR